MARLARAKVLARKTKAQRKEARARISLEDAGLTEATRARYASALFLLLPVLETVQHMQGLDYAISDWVEAMFKAGEPQHLISDALCGLHWREPWTKRLLPNAWRLFHIWRKVEIASRAPPLTSALVRSMAFYCIEHQDLQMAAALLVGFYGLLRTGEILNLRLCDCLLKNGHCIISLLETKTGKRKGIAEMVHISDVFTIETLFALQQLRREQGCPSGLLWADSASVFRNRFAFYCNRFDLSSQGFRPYSLRRGGATHVFQQTRSMEYTLMLGRWESTRVARCYISDALSFLPSMILSTKTKALLKHFPSPVPEVSPS